ncbi:MAG: hypothetical protein DRP46_03460 [Candidatus Zixiibacteriota bacterium]|nr:MAG: hypothetical protein DRP46_03460 [candidate division Zixibacteria bacterium]
MQIKLGKKYIFLILATIVMATSIGVCKYTRLFSLRHISVDPAEYIEDGRSLGLAMEQNLFAARLENAAESLFKKERVLKVDIDYALPDGINIVINDIKPLAVVIGDDGKELYALDERCYLLPYNDEDGKFDYPIIAGLKKTRPYKKITDDRLYLLVDQLSCLKKDCMDFYLALSCIDMTNKEYISVFFDGLPFPVDMYAGSLHERVNDLEIFLLDFNPDLNDVDRLDMRSEGLIISAS